MYSDDELLALSGIQHFAFCRRQWALIHLEQSWKDNLLTALGETMHDRAHDEAIREKRGDLIIVRGLSVYSYQLGVSGKADVVEFRRSKTGHPLYGEDGLWSERPVEYKRGASKATDVDRLQLCAQAICLEEMLGSTISYGYLFYGKTNSREKVLFTHELRSETQSISAEMHKLFKRNATPKVRPTSNCKSCSLSEICLPRLNKGQTASAYLASYIGEREGHDEKAS